MIVKKRVIWYAFSFVIMAILSVAMILVSKGYYYDFETNSLKLSGKIYVRSLPRESNILINGEIKKEKSPTSIPLPEGAYTLRVEKEGYIPWEKNILVKAGRVTWENYVFLIKEDRQEEKITENGVLDFLVSPSYDKIAYTDINQSLWIVNIKKNEHKKIKDSQEEKIDIIEWDRKNNKILWSETLNKQVRYFIGNEEEKTEIKYTPGKIKKIEISQEDENKVFILSENYLYETSGENTSIREDGVLDFSQNENNIYYSKNSTSLSSLWKSNFSFSSKEKLTEMNEKITKIFPARKNKLAFLTKTGDFYLLEKDLKKIYSKVEDIKWSKEDKKILYKTSRELRVYVLESDNEKEKGDKIVTRLSTSISECNWFYNYYHIIYKTGSDINFVGLDGTNSVVLTNKSGDIPKISNTKYGRKLIFPKKEDDTNNIVLMQMGENLGLIPY